MARGLERLDPDGDRCSQDPWLADHVHRWVAQAWLDVGEVGRASAVLAQVPASFIAASSRLRRLQHDIADAREAQELGESVYPWDVPIDERWIRPRTLDQSETVAITQWAPGRVIGVDNAGVHVVYAVAPEDTHWPKYLARRSFEAREWDELSGGGAPHVDTYFELMRFADGRVKIELVPAKPRDLDSHAADIASAYLQRWHSPEPSP